MARRAGALLTRFKVDGLGQRVAKYSSANAPLSFVQYDLGGHVLGQYTSTGGLTQETIWLGDLPVGVLTPTGPLYVAPDQLGSPHQITNAAQQVVWLWDHDPFGNGKPKGTFTYDLRFPGQLYDSETGNHYNYYRDYDPRIGRYIESDPLGLAGGTNTYAYVGGNPVGFTDPLGLDTYIVNRDLQIFGNNSQPRWNPITHTFVVVTNRDGSVSHTYSWGNAANVHGWNRDQLLDITTAAEALKDGEAEWVGGSSLDPYVEKAFDFLNKPENEHANWFVVNNCKSEAQKLIDKARNLQINSVIQLIR